MTQNKRGEQRFAAVTHSLIAEWTGLSVITVQKYAARGAFDRWNLESVLAWVNGRRAAAGLPLIGMPKVFDKADADKAAVELIGVPPEVLRDRTWIPIPPPASGGYNPKTGEYDL